ncbi:MAG: hypothetical protein JJE04_13395 [Acidobacteriia bacterium]|nr:hypothetical protein [Terriglobia bacterium]
MAMRFSVALLLGAALWGAPEWVLIRTVDGTVVEGRSSGRVGEISLAQILSVHNAAAASALEAGRIQTGLAAIQAQDRKARDQAVEELTSIGLPVMTPLLDIYEDTDQHEPRPLYRLFERLIPSHADGFDRTLSLVRLRDGTSRRTALPEGTLEVQAEGGGKSALPWSKIRTLAVRQKLVRRSVQVHSIRHSTQIEYMDTGVILSAGSRLDSTALGFVRLSWNADGWASDANGLTKPGSPAYKTNLVDGHPFGALVGRVGADGEVFFLGKKASKTGLPAGRLGVAINDNRHWQNNLGSFYVTVAATDAYDAGEAQ